MRIDAMRYGAYLSDGLRQLLLHRCALEVHLSEVEGPTRCFARPCFCHALRFGESFTFVNCLTSASIEIELLRVGEF